MIVHGCEAIQSLSSMFYTHCLSGNYEFRYRKLAVDATFMVCDHQTTSGLGMSLYTCFLFHFHLFDLGRTTWERDGAGTQ